jgi:hypothetical protein
MMVSPITAALCATAAALLVFAGPARSATITIPVAEDISVNRANPDGNLNTLTTRGGLFSGLDDTGSDYSFYLKFVLPVQPEPVTGVTLIGTYTDDFGAVDWSHQVFFVPSDAWSETTVTFNMRPELGDPIPGALFEAAAHQPGETIDFTLTDAVNAELAGDGVLSLGVATIDGRLGDLEFFASKEFDASRAFRLELTSGGDAIPVSSSLPAPLVLLAAVAIAILARITRV